MASACAQPAGPAVSTVPPGDATKASRPAEAATPAHFSPETLPALPTAPARDSYNRCNVEGPFIALTFDDGPHPQLTPKLLDLLKARGVRATFYLIGKNASAHPDIVARMAAEGHEIGNHSWNHQAFPKLPAARVATELRDTNAVIEQASGKPPATFRPPYGATTTALNHRIAEEFAMKVVLWSVDPQDWKYRNSARIASHIIENTKPGDIILAHDIHPTTIAAMPKVVDALLAKGFQFLTVSELIARDRPIEVARHPVGEPAPAR